MVRRPWEIRATARRVRNGLSFQGLRRVLDAGGAPRVRIRHHRFRIRTADPSRRLYARLTRTRLILSPDGVAATPPSTPGPIETCPVHVVGFNVNP